MSMVAHPFSFQTIRDILQHANSMNGHRIAIDDNDGALTFAQLGREVLDLAAQMPAPYEGRAVIALHGMPDRAFLITLLAIWASGNIVMTIDKGGPPERKTRLANAEWIDLIVDFDFADEQQPLLSDRPIWRPSMDTPVPQVPLTTRFADRPDAAYIIYSSGSTGVPKTILGRGSSLDHFVIWQAKQFGFGPGDRIPVITSPSFDPFFREVLTPLFSGATLVVIPAHVRSAPDQLVERLQETAVTRLHAVPTLVEHWCSAMEQAEICLESLRTTFFAGEPLSSDLVERWRRLALYGEVVNLYGPSETTLAKFFNIIPANPLKTSNLPVGYPLPDTRAIVLDSEGRPAPDGESGRIFIDTAFATYGTIETGWAAGDGLATLAEKGPRLYPTGDYGAIQNGELVVLGRTDHQVKIAGVRFNPGEVAQALREINGISDAYAFAVDNDGQKIIHAIYVLSPGAEIIKESEIRAALRMKIVVAMIPSRLVSVATLPFTSNGKIDQTAAKTLTCTAAVPEPAEEAHLPLLTDVLEAFRHTFPAQEVMAEDNFFAIGGDSLNATQLANVISVRTGCDCELADVLDYPTPLSLAAHLSTASKDDAWPERIMYDAARGAGDGAFQLSERQLAYRTLCMSNGDMNWCILSRVLKDIGQVTEQMVRAAFLELADRHDAISLRFPDPSNFDTQIAVTVDECDAEALEVATLDFTHLSQSEIDRKISQIRAEGSRRLFDLTRWPLVRMTLIYCPLDTRLIVWVHHLILDGPSLNIFVSSLVDILKGRGLTLSKSKAQYRDFVIWQNNRNAGEQERDRRYWMKLLDGAKPVEVDEDGPPGDASQGYIFTRPFTGGLVQAVGDAAVRWCCTPFVILLAAYIQAIGQRAKNASPCVIIPMQVKGPKCFAETLGVFFTQAIVRMETVDIDGTGRFAPKILSQLASSSRHSGYEFHHRLNDLGLVPDSETFPLTTALFNQNRIPEGMSYEAATPFGTHGLGRSLRFQIQGEVQSQGDDFLISYLFREGTFSNQGGIEAFADTVEAKIRELVQ